jgi:hypothetical protein
MLNRRARKRRRIFISHASSNVDAARDVQTALRKAGYYGWLDDSDIHIGVLLRKQLQQAILDSEAVVLLWSKPASRSRWIASEILTSFHLNRFIVPCLLSSIDLPQFLSRSVFCDLRRARADALEKLGRQLTEVPKMRNEFTEIAPIQSSELRDTIRRLIAKQREILDTPDAHAALALQVALDPEMHAAEKKWRFDSSILNLAGYHRKNAYMFKYWNEYCAARFPSDPLLHEAERFFYEALFVNPLDYGALNGLGNILLFEGELQAALFFVEQAIQYAGEAGVDYEEAKHDHQLILHRMRIAKRVSGSANV